MKKMVWQSQQAPYIQNLAFASYCTFEEKRPVKIDCSLGINPLSNLYGNAGIYLTASQFGRYPASGAHKQHALTDWVIKRFPKVSAESVCFGAGSQGLLGSIARVLGGPGMHILAYTPGYLPAFLDFSFSGAKVDLVELEAPAYHIDVDALIDRLQEDTALLYIDNPHNPTGQVVPLSDLERLGKACLKNGTLLLVDEAYGDFVTDANSVLQLDLPNLLCMKSLSKGYGLAGLRLGYLVINDPNLLASYREAGLVYTSSEASAVIASAFVPLLDLEHMRAEVAALKQRLLSFLYGIPDFFIATTNPNTPIILLGWKQDGDLYNAFMDVGIQTEPSRFFALPSTAYVRLRVPSEEQFTLFCSLVTKRFFLAP